MKSQGLPALLTQRVHGPETLAVGHLAYTGQGAFQKLMALATLRGKGLHMSQGPLQNPGVKSGSLATPGPPPPPASSPGQVGSLPGSFPSLPVAPGITTDRMIRQMHSFYAASQQLITQLRLTLQSHGLSPARFP